jgi:predicted RNA binding protein YcfA (HicA-like mRNA interferase family)
MTYRELTRRLRRLGCVFDRRGRGDHEIWINPANRQRTTVPNWGSKDLTPGTIHGILRDLGILRQDFDET